MEPASWVRATDRDPLVLTQSFYTKPVTFYNGWELIKKSARIGIYRRGNSFIVVCKGTTPTHGKDIFDDLVIGGVLEGQVTLETEALYEAKKLPPDSEIILAGHSLGGRVAMSVASKLQVRACVFNPAAPPNNMLTEGPGAGRATVYQISGDLISNNIHPNCGEVIRVNQGYNPLQTVEAHTMANFSQPALGFYSEKQEETYISTSLAYGASIAGASKALEQRAPILRLLKFFPMAYSNVDLLTDRVDVMQVNQKPVAFVTSLTDPTKTFVDKKLVPKGISKWSALVKQVSKLNFFSTNSSNLDEAVISANAQASKFLPYSVNKSVSDLILTDATSGKSIEEKALMQSIGITDDISAAVQYASKTADPPEYLRQVQQQLSVPSAEIRLLQESRLSKLPEVGQDVPDIELPTPKAGKSNILPNNSFGGVAKSLLGKLAGIFQTTPEAAQNLESENLANSSKYLLLYDPVSLLKNAFA